MKMKCPHCGEMMTIEGKKHEGKESSMKEKKEQASSKVESSDDLKKIYKNKFGPKQY